MWKGLAIGASLITSIAMCVVTYFLYELETHREELDLKRLALVEVRTHRLRMSEIETAYVCTSALMQFPEQIAGQVVKYRAIPEPVSCDAGWCARYRRCIDATPEEIPDGENIEITEDISWTIVLPIRSAIESYESLARIGCTGAADAKIILDHFRTEFHRKSAFLDYVERFFEPDEGDKHLPGITAVMGNLYPNEYPNWVNNCPEPE